MRRSHLAGAHTYGSAGFGAGDQLAQLIAILGAVVIGVDVVKWLRHILVIIATATGFIALGAGAGHAAVIWRRFKRPQLSPPPPLYPAPQLYRPALPGKLTPYRPAAQALPPGGEVHLHLHGPDAQAILRAIGQQGGDIR
jgi:hypothetical protein